MNRITLDDLRNMLVSGYTITCSYTNYYQDHSESEHFVAHNILFGNSAFANIQIGLGQVAPTSEGVIVYLNSSMPYAVFEAWRDYQENYLLLNGKGNEP